MILVHGELGSGRSRVLRELEARPPDGYRGIYVPVPTLDLPGLARWCLDQLGRPPSADPLAALAREERTVLLVDDAEQLPPAAAAGLRDLERAAPGALTVVAACESGAVSAPAVAALGVPALALRIGADASPLEVAKRVRDGFPAGRILQAPPPTRPAAARLGSGAGVGQRVEPRTGASAPPSPPASAPAVAQGSPAGPPARPRAAQPSAQPATDSKPPRMVPLWLATVIGVAAFLIPVAFLAGFLVASEWIGARARALPDVAAGPPSARESAPHATAPSTAAPARTPATEALSGDAARAAHDGLALAALPTPAPAQERSPGPPLDASPATALESNPAEDTGAGPAPTLLRVGPPPR